MKLIEKEKLNANYRKITIMGLFSFTYPKKMKHVSLVSLGLLNQCSFGCVFCPFHSPFLESKRKQDKNNAKLIEEIFINEYEKIGSIDIDASGEILSSKSAMDFTKKFQGKINNFVSNASLLDDEKIEYILSIKEKIVNKITFSINTTDEIMYQDIHFTNRKLEETLYYIEKLLNKLKNSEGNIPKVELSMVVMQSNKNQMEELARIAKKINCNILRFIPLLTVPNYKNICGEMKSGKHFSYEEEMIDQSSSEFVENFEKAKAIFGENTNILELEDNQKDVCMCDCTQPFEYLQVFANGEYKPCCFSEKYLGNIFDDNIKNMENLLNNKKLKGLRKDILNNKLNDYCRGANCSYVKNYKKN